MTYTVQRMSVRYKGEIPLEVKQGAGLTRDFSASGLYFTTDQVVSVGERLEVVMRLEYTGVGHDLYLRCQGEVLRVEPAVEKMGVAFAISSHAFEPR